MVTLSVLIASNIGQGVPSCRISTGGPFRAFEVFKQALEDEQNPNQYGVLSGINRSPSSLLRYVAAIVDLTVPLWAVGGSEMSSSYHRVFLLITVPAHKTTGRYFNRAP